MLRSLAFDGESLRFRGGTIPPSTLEPAAVAVGGAAPRARFTFSPEATVSLRRSPQPCARGHSGHHEGKGRGRQGLGWKTASSGVGEAAEATGTATTRLPAPAPCRELHQRCSCPGSW